MRRIIYGLFVISYIFMTGCEKNEQVENINENDTLESYIKNLIDVDENQPYLGEYYIYINFGNKELRFNVNDQKQAILATGNNGRGMSIQGISLTDSTTNESLRIGFYSNIINDTTFNFYIADYIYADGWSRIEGAQVGYSVPVSESEPNIRDTYDGENTLNSYFHIIYIGEDRINGTFQTTLREISFTNLTYNVYGDFSIPTDKLWNSNLNNK